MTRLDQERADANRRTIKVGDRVTRIIAPKGTGTVVRIETMPGVKPLIVRLDSGGLSYNHWDQVIPVDPEADFRAALAAFYSAGMALVEAWDGAGGWNADAAFGEPWITERRADGVRTLTQPALPLSLDEWLAEFAGWYDPERVKERAAEGE